MMAEGYEDSRFVKPIDEDLHCVICKDVLKDPVQCERNEHHFCRSCITTYLQHSPKCAICQDPLTVETLGRPSRFLANTLASLKIMCKNAKHGCREVMELASLNTHEAQCGFTPLPCSNDGCKEIINRRDKEIHQSKICGFREVNCEYCGEMLQYMNYMQHTCPARKEVREMKAELNEVRTTQNEMFRAMRGVMSDLTIIKRCVSQSSGATSTNSNQNLQAEIVIAGGVRCKSVEAFSMATKTWRSLSDMSRHRVGASAVLYQGRILVTGGFDGQCLKSIEEFNLADDAGHWVESQFKLPVASTGHACVVYQNRVFVIGGYTDDGVNNEIHEIQPSLPSRLITTMPQPICYHGAEIIDDKVYILGGSTSIYSRKGADSVLRFDPTTNTCTKINSLPYPVSRMATLAWRDNVVVLGGLDIRNDVLNTVVLYNVTTGNYRMLANMIKKRCRCTAVVIGDNVVVIGGMDETHTALNSVESYNFFTNTWIEFPATAQARGDATAVVRYF